MAAALDTLIVAAVVALIAAPHLRSGLAAFAAQVARRAPVRRERTL